MTTLVVRMRLFYGESVRKRLSYGIAENAIFVGSRVVGYGVKLGHVYASLVVEICLVTGDVNYFTDKAAAILIVADKAASLKYLLYLLK